MIAPSFILDDFVTKILAKANKYVSKGEKVYPTLLPTLPMSQKIRIKENVSEA